MRKLRSTGIEKATSLACDTAKVELGFLGVHSNSPSITCHVTDFTMCSDFSEDLRDSHGSWKCVSVKLPVHCPASNRSSVKNTIRLVWTSQMKSDKAEGAKANIWTAEFISHQDYPYNCLVPHSTHSCHLRKPAGPWPFSNPQGMTIEERNVQLFFGMPTVQTLPRKQERYNYTGTHHRAILIPNPWQG